MSQPQSQTPLEEYNYVIQHLRNQQLELKQNQQQSTFFGKCQTMFVKILLTMSIIIVLLNLTRSTSIQIPILSFGASALTPKQSSLLHLQTFPLYSDISVGVIIGLSMLYGAIIAFIYSLYKQRQFQQTNQLLATQFKLMERYYRQVSHQHQRLRDAASKITIPYSLDALLDKNLDDFSTTSAQYQAVLAPSTYLPPLLDSSLPLSQFNTQVATKKSI